MAKIQPAQLELYFQVPDDVKCTIDLAHALSILNRRLYRQGMMYYVESINYAANAGAATFYAIPDTWVAHNAWKKGFKTWQTMQDEYMDGQGSALKGKWADFKVNISDEGLNFITPLDGNSQAYLTGEWIYSNFVYDDNGTTRNPTIHMIGTSTDDTAIGLIQAYGDARNYPGSAPDNPAAMATGFYAQFHGTGDIDDELGTDLRDDNDLPPYDQDQYPGGHDNGDYPIIVSAAATTSEVPIVNVGGFKAPCGLIQVHSDHTGSTASIIVKLAAGPYKGVMAEPMGQ